MLDVSRLLPSLRAMQMKLSKFATSMIAGIVSSGTAFAHPGHAPTDTVAQLAHPFAGTDHFAVFAVFSSLLLLTLRALIKRQTAKRQTARK